MHKEAGMVLGDKERVEGRVKKGRELEKGVVGRGVGFGSQDFDPDQTRGN